MPDRSSIGVRVRPNANNFIRDLERQLAAKKKTFYVDVKANLKPANKDIAEWARVGLKKIRAVVPVGASMFLATKDVAEWRRRQLNNKTNIPIGVNLTKAYAETLAFRKVASKDIEINLRINTQSADKAAERFEQAIARRGVSIPVHGDVTPAKRDIDRDLIHRFTSQGGVVLPVKADTSPAQRDLLAFTAKPHKIETQVEADTKKVRLELLQLRLNEARRKLTLDVEVKRGALQNFERDLARIGQTFGKLNIIRSMNLGPLNFGKPTGLVGTLATITALAGAVPGAVTALAALSKVLIDVAGAAAIVPGAIGAIAASLGTLVLGSQGIGDAFSAMFDMWKEGSDKQQTQAKGVARAHDQLTNAVTDEAQAQREVASARREATSDLRNLNNELRGSVLNEAQAILDLQKARDRLAQGGFDNATDRMQAELDVAKAGQNIIDVRERNNQLQQKANEENAKGVEGSDRVTQALENQTRASQAAAAAMQAISDTQVAGATSKFNDALAQLSPNAREAVLAVSGMKGELFDFRMLLQDKIFAGVGPALVNTFHGLEPILRSGMGRIAEGLNANILQIFDTLQSPAGQSIIERILGGTADAQAKFSKFLDPFIKGLGTLMAAGAEHLPQLIDLFTRLAERFALFIDTADKSGKLDEFMNRGLTALENIVEIGLNAIKIVNDLSNAFSGDLLGTIRDLTQRLHDFLSSDQGQQKLKEWIVEAKKLWEDWKPVLLELPGLFERLSNVAKRALDIITPTLTLILNALERAPGLVELFAAAWIGSKVVSGFAKVVELGRTITTLVKNLTGLPALLSRLPSVLPNTAAIASGGPGAGSAVAGPAASAAAGGGGAAATATATGGALIVLGGLAILANWEGKKAAEEQGRTRNLPIGPHGINAAVKPILPQGVPEPQTDEARASVQAGVDKNDPASRWVAAGTDTMDWQKRYVWVVRNPEKAQPDNFVPPDSYAVGGHTDWPSTVGRAALLHGNEYVEPADTVKHYGVKAMENIHKKRIPKEALAAEKYGFKTGGPVAPHPFHPVFMDDPGVMGPRGGNDRVGGQFNPGMKIDTSRASITPPWFWGTYGRGVTGQPAAFGSFQGGGHVDPNTGQWKMPNPMDSAVGPVPGPIPGTNVDTPVGPMANNSSAGPALNMFGLNIPFGQGVEMPADRGWGPGGAPPGLGGGSDAFDMRNFGIGPGPPGSGPADWGQFVAQTGGNLLSGIFQATFVKGLLGFFGAEGLVDSPYFQAATGLVSHFTDSAGAQGNIQAPGAADTNAAVADLLNTHAGMPVNPDTGVGNLPNVIDPKTGSAVKGHVGLQRNTARGEAIIRQLFPWATDIGGYSIRPAGTPQWHTKGLALDVMIPGAGGLNDPTPPAGKAKGDQLYAWLKAHQSELGIDYILWQEKDHYNHLHVNFSPSGYADGADPGSAPIPNGPLASAPLSSVAAPPGQWFPKPPPPHQHMRGGLVSFQGGGFMPGLGKYDSGGWLMPGRTLAHNATGRPELILPPDASSSFWRGGFNTAAIIPRPPFPPGPIAQPITRPPVAPPPPTAPPPMAPVAPPSVGPGAPGEAAPPVPGPPPIEPPPSPTPSTPIFGPGAPAPPIPSGEKAPGAPPLMGMPPPGTGVTPAEIGTGVGPGETGMHLHPAAQKGIASAAEVAGNLAAMAASMGMAGAGGAGGGGVGAMISGLFKQGGKIVTDIANVGASFLVGTVTGGTTKNPYGVTQRATNPSGGTRTVDRSTHYHGDMVTNNLDEYFRQMDLREAQQHQASVGTYDRYA